MKIAIIDADLIGRKNHRFPNLVCMKLSGYHKERGDDVTLKVDYLDLETYDKVYLAKVFSDTVIPEQVLELGHLEYGGTGFFYDKAKPLPAPIEHHMPDYHLYDEWVDAKIEAGAKAKDFTFYKDYSIGYLTRGCFRHCQFCVNKNYNKVIAHSPLPEFLDRSRKKICLLDDNFLGYPGWAVLLKALQATSKRFVFRQGLDERLLTPASCKALFSSKYDGDFIFAFDDIADSKLVEDKILLSRQYTNAILKFYCLCGYDRTGRWDQDFWIRDVFDLLERIVILMQHKCIPYVMKYNRYEESPFRSFLITVARWCNQPSLFKKKSLREFGLLNGVTSAANKSIVEFEKQFPEAAIYLDAKYS